MTLQLDSGQFFGTQRDQQSFHALTLTRTHYAHGDFLPPHGHVRSLFCCVLEGSHSDRVGRREFERDDRSLVWYPAGTVHSERHHSPGRHIHVELNDPFVQRWELDQRFPADVLDLQTPEAAVFKFRIQEEMSAGDDLTPLVIEGLLLELTAASVRRRRRARTPHWASIVDEILRASLRDPPSLTELALSTGLERSRLTREFRRLYGHTVGQEIRRLRVESACELLTTTELDLAEIANRVGFADQSHFTRVFRAAVGLPPGQYRRSLGS